MNDKDAAFLRQCLERVTVLSQADGSTWIACVWRPTEATAPEPDVGGTFTRIGVARCMTDILNRVIGGDD